MDIISIVKKLILKNLQEKAEYACQNRFQYHPSVNRYCPSPGFTFRSIMSFLWYYFMILFYVLHNDYFSEVEMAYKKINRNTYYIEGARILVFMHLRIRIAYWLIPVSADQQLILPIHWSLKMVFIQNIFLTHIAMRIIAAVMSGLRKSIPVLRCSVLKRKRILLKIPFICIISPMQHIPQVNWKWDTQIPLISPLMKGLRR